MTSNVKRTQAGVDRISALPENVIDLILQCLPIHDAARTSALSKTWKSVWENHPQLVFDENFFSELAGSYSISKTINNILLLHNGPMLKFHLFIPENLPRKYHDLDIWIKHISKCGVRKLELINDPLDAYKLPSYLFSCLELTDLWLDNCILRPPLGFGGFGNLISVKLIDVIITADISFGTQLKELWLRRCRGLEHLRCQFSDNNNLTMLKIFDCEGINWQWFECTKHVQNFGLVLKDLPYSAVSFPSIDKLFGNMPTIYILQLDGFLLEALNPVATNMNMLGTTLENLESLYLYRIRFDDMVQIKYVLCLIKSSPSLRYLHIELEATDVFPGSSTDLGLLKSVEEYMQSQDFFSLVVDQLETVNIDGTEGTETEFHFMKFLLASTPSLKWMELVGDADTIPEDSKEAYWILRELKRSPRASSAARIRWT